MNSPTSDIPSFIPDDILLLLRISPTKQDRYREQNTSQESYYREVLIQVRRNLRHGHISRARRRLRVPSTAWLDDFGFLHGADVDLPLESCRLDRVAPQFQLDYVHDVFLDFIGMVEEPVLQDVALGEEDDGFVDVGVEEKAAVFRGVHHQETRRGTLKLKIH